MSQLISATQARNKFAEIVNRVIYKGEEFLVQKRGKTVVKIVPVDSKSEKNKQTDPGTQFLLKLAKVKAKGLPKDLSQSHDKYAWD